jgi:glutamyl-tRNA reductase
VSLLVLGLSHRSAPLELLELVALSSERAAQLADTVHRAESVGEAVVVATCNRVEVYADAVTFHGAVSEIVEALSRATSVPMERLREHLYVHYEDRAIAHLFSVACGLDSMAVGEGQILGQLREALRSAQRQQSISSILGDLFQHALRVGKRAHAETEIDRVSGSLIEAGLERAGATLGPLSQQRVLVVGAGSMSSLAAMTLSRRGARELVILNRTAATAERLATATGGSARPWGALAESLTDADLVISCTGAVGHVIDAASVTAAQTARSGRHQVYVDLALPRDVDPEVGHLAGITLVGLREVGQLLDDSSTAPPVQAVEDLIVGEVGAFLAGRRAKSVAPTVAALRSRAADVVAAELVRLEQRAPSLSEEERAEVQLTVHRVVEKLLHAPSVRMKELAVSGASGDYAQALRDLFDLDPHDVATVSVPPEQGGLA